MITEKQGILDIGGTILSTGLPDVNIQLSSYSFYNVLAYTITVEKYEAETASTITLGVYSKLAGETFELGRSNVLKEGDYIKVTPSIAGTSYIFLEI